MEKCGRRSLLRERAHASGRGTKGGMGKRDLNALLGVGKKSGGAKKKGATTANPFALLMND